MQIFISEYIVITVYYERKILILFKVLDYDQFITLNPSPQKLSKEETQLVDDYRNLNNDGRYDFLEYLNYLKFKYCPNF